MINTKPFNDFYFNEIPLDTWVLSTAPAGKVVFNGYSLDDSSNGLTLKNLRYEDMPTRDLQTYSNPFTDGRTITNTYFRDQKVYVTCRLEKNTIANLESELTALKQKLQGVNKSLIVREVNRDILYKATLTNTSEISRRTKYNRNICDLTFEFTAFDFGSDENFRSERFESITSSSYEFVYTNSGAYQSDLVFVVIVNSETDMTDFTITNDTTGKAITITRAFVAADYVTVDGQKGTLAVTLAPSTELDFTGVFPRIDVGYNVFTLATTSTAHNIDLIIKTKFNY